MDVLLAGSDLFLCQDAVNTIRSAEENIFRSFDLTNVHHTGVFLQINRTGFAFCIGTGTGLRIQIAYPVIANHDLQRCIGSQFICQEIIDIILCFIGVFCQFPQILKDHVRLQGRSICHQQCYGDLFGFVSQFFVALCQLDADHTLARQCITVHSFCFLLTTVDIFHRSCDLGRSHIPLLGNQRLFCRTDAALCLQRNFISQNIGLAFCQFLGSDGTGNILNADIPASGLDLTHQDGMCFQPDMICCAKGGSNFLSAVYSYVNIAFIIQIQLTSNFTDDDLALSCRKIHEGIVQLLYGAKGVRRQSIHNSCIGFCLAELFGCFFAFLNIDCQRPFHGCLFRHSCFGGSCLCSLQNRSGSFSGHVQAFFAECSTICQLLQQDIDSLLYSLYIRSKGFAFVIQVLCLMQQGFCLGQHSIHFRILLHIITIAVLNVCLPVRQLLDSGTNDTLPVKEVFILGLQSLQILRRQFFQLLRLQCFPVLSLQCCNAFDSLHQRLFLYKNICQCCILLFQGCFDFGKTLSIRHCGIIQGFQNRVPGLIIQCGKGGDQLIRSQGILFI